jgi:hypothetical protein
VSARESCALYTPPCALSRVCSCGSSCLIASCDTVNTRPFKQPIAGEIKGRDFDFGLLVGLDKTDITVRDHRLDLEVTADRNNYEEGLGGCYHTSNRVHRKLLHNAFHWCGQQLQPRSLLGFDQILGEPSGDTRK